jgi:hypothetical protein
VPISEEDFDVSNIQSRDVSNGGVTGSGDDNTKLWSHSVVVGNKIYFIPYSARYIVELTPGTSGGFDGVANATFNTIGPFDISNVGASSFKFERGVVVGTDIYMIPSSSIKLLKLNTIDLSYTLTDIPDLNGSLFSSGLLHNGIIYCSPNDYRSILTIDTNSGDDISQIQLVADVSDSIFKYNSLVHTNNDMIALLPRYLKLTILDTCDNSIKMLPEYTESYYGGVLSTNESIYAIPSTSSKMIRLDGLDFSNILQHTDINLPTTESSTSYRKYYGGVIDLSHNIHMIPYCDTQLLSYSTLSNSSIIGTRIANHTFSYAGGCLGPNNKVYCIPHNSNSVGILTISNNTPSLDETTISGTGPEFTSIHKYSGGVILPNRHIFCIPYSYSDSLIINPTDNTTTTHTYTNVDIVAEISSGTPGLWSGGVIATNNKVYMIPYNSQYIAIYDSVTNTESVIDISGIQTTRNHKWSGGVLGRDGYIYMMPHMETNILKVDPQTDIVTTIPYVNEYGTRSLKGAVSYRDGSVAGIANNRHSFLHISQGINVTPEYVLYPYYNKL